jgi:uncharacterized protein YkwD
MERGHASSTELAPAGVSGETGKLIELINEYRSSPQTCEGRQTAAVGPLAPQAVLARSASVSDIGSLQEALKRAGYTPAQLQSIMLSGPGSARDAFALLTERYCSVLSSAQFADIGISREGDTWRIVLARPLLSSGLGDWREAGKAVLEFTNAARARDTICGERHFGPATPLEWNEELASAALAHSRDMATHNYFSHYEKDGSTVGDRAARAGYTWSRIGENIAAGQGSPEQVVAGWIKSPHHCANIMEPDFRQMGAAYYVDPTSDTVIYWTQVFGTPTG